MRTARRVPRLSVGGIWLYARHVCRRSAVLEGDKLMDAQTCLKKMQLIGVLSLATVDEDGSPQIRCVSAVHYESDGFYFFTAEKR